MSQKYRLSAIPKLHAGITIAALFCLLLWQRSSGSSQVSQAFNTYEVIRNPRGNYAYAFFLAKPSGAMVTGREEDDLYYLQTRMMVWQLLHDPPTQTVGYPVVVLVTEDVEPAKRHRLTQDGAIVREVQNIPSAWIRTATPAWQDVLAKLHLFNLVEYDKVAFFDADTIFRRPVDGIFDDPATETIRNLGNESRAPADEGVQPATYMFAGNHGAGGHNHAYPPPPSNNLNAGCMVLRPSNEMFDYYMRIANCTDRFPRKYPEQGLWAYAHRWDGNMPWKQIHYDWNTNWVTSKDIGYGFASLHVKFWVGREDMVLKDHLMRVKSRMEGYYMAMDDEL